MGKNTKRKHVPKEAYQPHPGKDARTAIEDPQRELEKPVWRFRRMVFEGPFGCHEATGELAREVHGKLSNFETMKWSEIGRADKQHHYLSWDSLSKLAREEVEKRCREEERETIFQFRLSGKERVIGIRLAGIFDLIWWDPEHQFCPSELKNT